MPCLYTVRKRGAENVKATKNTKCWCKMFLADSLHCMHFTTESHVSWDFPTKSSSEATAIFVLRIHGRLRLEEPLGHGIVAFAGCHVQRCFASGAAARGQATGRTQQNEGEKNSEKNLGASKVEVLEILATQKTSLDLVNIVVLRMFWWHRVGWKSHVNQVGSQNDLREPKKMFHL